MQLINGDTPVVPSSSYLVWYEGQRSTSYNDGITADKEYSDQNLSYFKNRDRDILESSKYEHLFCGEQNIPGAWCPNCDKPLLRFLELDTSDPRLELHDTDPARIPLLYCWTCNISSIDARFETDGNNKDYVEWYVDTSIKKLVNLVFAKDEPLTSSAPFMYKIMKDCEIRLLQYGKGGCEKSFPYKNYPLYFPAARAYFIQLTLEAEAAIYAENRGDDVNATLLARHTEIDMPRHQVGGEPWLVQSYTDMAMRCPECDNLMPRLASMGDDCLDQRGFVGYGGVQVLYYYCVECSIVGCFNLMD